MSIVVFEMGSEGHFQRVCALVSGFARRGITAHVFTHARFAERVTSAGGHFIDLFATHPIEAADAESIPQPSRYVTFAAHYGRAIAAEVAALAPQLVISDTFSVIGRVVASLLGVPHVNVCSGHNQSPAIALGELARDPRVETSERCHRAVEILRDELGILNASPFSYVDGLSRHLNIYCEPPQFLTEDERRAFEPIAFFGSLRDDHDAPGPVHDFGGAGSRIYVSFGTIIWRYYRAAAHAALSAIVEAIAERPDVRGLVTLGRGGDATGLARPNVTVVDYIDQQAVLRAADVFITHHGVNSTHEAIGHQVPMISYPFFADQPPLAARCQSFGIAIPLVAGSPPPRGPVSVADVRTALETMVARGPAVRERLAEARAWELAVMAGREQILDRLLEIANQPATSARHSEGVA